MPLRDAGVAADRRRGLRRTACVLALLACITLVLGACGGTGGGTRKRGNDDPDKQAAEMQVKLGQGYLQQGKLEIAQEKLQRALQLDPSSVDAHTMLAVLNERISRPEQAERFYRRATELKPDGGAVNNNYGAFLCGKGRYDEAETYFQRAIADPFYKTPGDAFGNAGACAMKAGKTEVAAGYFRRALEAQPRNAVALYEMARLSYATGDNLRARAFMQRLEAVTAAEPEILELAERIETRLGDADAAKRYRQRLNDEFPDYQPVDTTEGSPSP